MFKWLWLFLIGLGEAGAGETTSTTYTEGIPTAVSASLIEIQQGDVVKPLIRQYPFPGPGLVHSTPIVSKLAAEADDSLANQALDTGTYTGSPSNATVGVHGSTVFLKEIAVLGAVDELMSVAGQIIGTSIVVQRDTDLVTLFTSITAIEGDANELILPADLFSAFNKLKIQNAPMPYSLVLHPGNMWGANGLQLAFANVADAGHYSGAVGGGIGTVGEDIMRNGWTGRLFGFDMYVDSNLATVSLNASGCAFSRDAFKYVSKRDFRIDVLFSGPEVGWQVTGTEMWGEAVLKNNFGVEMQFNTA